MTLFWLAATAMLLLAFTFLLIPIVRQAPVQMEKDRTALNVTLYQERIAELEVLYSEGGLSVEQLEQDKAEFAKELLRDTDQAGERRTYSLGFSIPLIGAVLVPLAAFILYVYWGSSDKLEVAYEMAQPVKSMEDIVARLEKVTRVQPESYESWYYLGQGYMAESRPADAVKAFKQVLDITGPQPQVMGLMAQAMFFANGREISPDVQAVIDQALKLNPDETTSLQLLGIADFEKGNYKDAVGYWMRVVNRLLPQDASRAAIQDGIDSSLKRLEEQGQDVSDLRKQLEASRQIVSIKVQVTLDPLLRGKVEPNDSLFIFARKTSGPAMPLAAKRLQVKDLPLQITLSDADAVTPQLKLSDNHEILVVARISRQGNSTRGEWIGKSGQVALDASDKMVSVTIDQADENEK